MLKKFLAAAAAASLMLVTAIVPAQAANRQGDAGWSSNGSTLTIKPFGGRSYTFGASDSLGPDAACSSAQIRNIVNNYPSSDTRRIPYVGDIDHVIAQLENREYGDGIYWEFIDCGKPLGGLLSGLICIDFEAGYQDRARVFEVCGNVTEVGRRSNRRVIQVY